MSYAVFLGKQRSLVFPIMCNGYLTLDYSDNIASTGDGITYGLWALDDNFTFECVVTPYDINGYGTYSAEGHTLVPTTGSLSHTSGQAIMSSSKKISTALPQSIHTAATHTNHESELYLPRADRITHEMRLFHSTNFQVSLVNATEHNENNPAQYKIKVGVKLGTAAMEYFTSDVVIAPNTEHQLEYVDLDDNAGYDEEGRVGFRDIGDTTSEFSGASVNFTDADDFLFDNCEVFVRDGFTFTSIGTVSGNPTASGFTLNAAPSITVASGSTIFIRHLQEPAYINNTSHIACAWDNENKQLDIFYNGRRVKTGIHTQTDSFVMSAEDFYIGANGTGSDGAGSATTNNQFMGELHELSIMKIRKTSFTALNNLMPKYQDTVLFLRFEEVDE